MGAAARLGRRSLRSPRSSPPSDACRGDRPRYELDEVAGRRRRRAVASRRSSAASGSPGSARASTSADGCSRGRWPASATASTTTGGRPSGSARAGAGDRHERGARRLERRGVPRGGRAELRLLDAAAQRGGGSAAHVPRRRRAGGARRRHARRRHRRRIDGAHRRRPERSRLPPQPGCRLRPSDGAFWRGRRRTCAAEVRALLPALDVDAGDRRRRHDRRPSPRSISASTRTTRSRCTVTACRARACPLSSSAWPRFRSTSVAAFRGSSPTGRR